MLFVKVFAWEKRDTFHGSDGSVCWTICRGLLPPTGPVLSWTRTHSSSVGIHHCLSYLCKTLTSFWLVSRLVSGELRWQINQTRLHKPELLLKLLPRLWIQTSPFLIKGAPLPRSPRPSMRKSLFCNSYETITGTSPQRIICFPIIHIVDYVPVSLD